MRVARSCREQREAGGERVLRRACGIAARDRRQRLQDRQVHRIGVKTYRAIGQAEISPAVVITSPGAKAIPG